MVRVVGVGALNWDRLFLVDRLAAAGEEIVIRQMKEEAGGSAANTIAALGRFAVECSFIGKIGGDAEGDRIIRALEDAGVETKGIVRAEGSSGGVFSFVDDVGERTMYVNPSVNDSIGAEDIKEGYFNHAEFVHLSSFAGAASIKTVMGIPSLMGDARLSFSPGFLSWRGMDFLNPLLRSCSILFLNEKEARALTDADAFEAVDKLRESGVETIVITRGENGCLVAGAKDGVKVPGEKVDVVDTTGAGDAFAAGFLFGRLNNFSDVKSGKIGNFVASRCVQRLGARAGLPDKEALDEFLKNLL